MAEALPLRRAGPVSAWFAASLVFPNDEKLEERDLPRVYLAPYPARADWHIVRASLEAAGLRPPRWLASGRSRIDEATMRDAFLSGDAVLLPLQPPRRGPDRLARLLHWARAAGREVDLVPIETLWVPARGRASLWNLLSGNPYDPKPWRR